MSAHLRQVQRNVCTLRPREAYLAEKSGFRSYKWHHKMTFAPGGMPLSAGTVDAQISSTSVSPALQTTIICAPLQHSPTHCQAPHLHPHAQGYSASSSVMTVGNMQHAQVRMQLAMYPAPEQPALHTRGQRHVVEIAGR